MPTARSERRASERYQVRVAVAIESGARKGRLGLSVDASSGGVLFQTTSRFETGEDLSLTLYLPNVPPHETRLRGKVVRVSDNSSDSFWKHLAAVRFEEPAPVIDAHLAGGPTA